MSLYNYAYFPLFLPVHTHKSHEMTCLGRDPAGRRCCGCPRSCCLTASTPRVLPLSVPEWEQKEKKKKGKKQLQPSQTLLEAS